MQEATTHVDNLKRATAKSKKSARKKEMKTNFAALCMKVRGTKLKESEGFWKQMHTQLFICIICLRKKQERMYALFCVGLTHKYFVAVIQDGNTFPMHSECIGIRPTDLSTISKQTLAVK